MFRREQPISKEFWRDSHNRVARSLGRRKDGKASWSRVKKKNLLQVAASERVISQVIYGALEDTYPRVPHEFSDKSFSEGIPLPDNKAPLSRPRLRVGRHWEFVGTICQVEGVSRFSNEAFDISFSFCKITLPRSTIYT